MNFWTCRLLGAWIIAKLASEEGWVRFLCPPWLFKHGHFRTSRQSLGASKFNYPSSFQAVQSSISTLLNSAQYCLDRGGHLNPSLSSFPQCRHIQFRRDAQQCLHALHNAATPSFAARQSILPSSVKNFTLIRVGKITNQASRLQQIFG